MHVSHCIYILVYVYRIVFYEKIKIYILTLFVQVEVCHVESAEAGNHRQVIVTRVVLGHLVHANDVKSFDHMLLPRAHMSAVPIRIQLRVEPIAII